MTNFNKYLLCISVAIYLNSVLHLLMAIAKTDIELRVFAGIIFAFLSSYFAIEIFAIWRKRK